LKRLLKNTKSNVYLYAVGLHIYKCNSTCCLASLLYHCIPLMLPSCTSQCSLQTTPRMDTCLMRATPLNEVDLFLDDEGKDICQFDNNIVLLQKSMQITLDIYDSEVQLRLQVRQWRLLVVGFKVA